MQISTQHNKHQSFPESLACNNFKPPEARNTAVLFLVFNRPDTTWQVFEAIRQAKPPRLYVAADGPKENQKDETKLCDQVRKIATEVDWECEVKTLFRDENLGCRIAVSSAIDWFFKNEEQGIILEDDCLPSQSFFWYCQELLEHYKSDERIMVVSGNNFQQGEKVTPYSYYFSRYNHCWGWATWKRAWNHYDHDMRLWTDFKKENGLDAWADRSRLFIPYWNRIFDSVAARQIDSWAYIWTFSCWAQGGMTCLPHVNLVKNIGIGEDATHTTKTNNSINQLRRHSIHLPLSHPNIIIRNTAADRFTDKQHFKVRLINILSATIRDKLTVLFNH